MYTRMCLASTCSSQLEVNISVALTHVTSSTILKMSKYNSSIAVVLIKFSNEYNPLLKQIYYFCFTYVKVQTTCEADNDKNILFSPAELSVVKQLARGYSEKEIAEKLNLSYHTVNNHLRNIRERHNIQKNTEIIILYAASLSKKKVSFKEVKEFGLSILFVVLNVCDYTQINV